MKVNNIRSWNDYMELNYPMLLISHWIPFNAWYVSTTGLHADRDCLIYFKQTPDNKIYTRIRQLLGRNNKDYESIVFKHEFVELDKLLEHKDFPTIEAPIFFGSVEMGENLSFEEQKIDDGIRYTVRRYKKDNDFGKPAKSIDVVKENMRTHDSETIFLQKHDVMALKAEMKKKKWNRKQCKISLETFNAVAPVIRKDVKDYRRGSVPINGRKYNSDFTVLAASIIDVLYELRCRAVHGEIEIDRKAEGVYKHAFTMLKILTNNFY